MEQALIIIGLARTGKDTAAEYLSRTHGFHRITFSDVIAEEVQRRGMRNTKMNQSIVGDALRKEQGMDAVARLAAEKAGKHDKVVFVGARSPEEIDWVRRHSKQTWVVKLESKEEIRSSRGKELAPSDAESTSERDTGDIARKGFGEVLEKADYTIENNGSREKLFGELEKAIRKI